MGKPEEAKAKEVLGAVIQGSLAFQKAGKEIISFKVVDKQGRLLGNPLVQFPAALLPGDYAQEKYEVSGSVEYRIDVKERPKK